MGEMFCVPPHALHCIATSLLLRLVTCSMPDAESPKHNASKL